MQGLERNVGIKNSKNIQSKELRHFCIVSRKNIDFLRFTE